MRVFWIGLACCVVGILLTAVNWLGAAVNVSQVTEWDGSRLFAAYSVVGYMPTVFGVALLVVGAVLLCVSPSAPTQPGEGTAPEGVADTPPGLEETPPS